MRLVPVWLTDVAMFFSEEISSDFRVLVLAIQVVVGVLERNVPGWENVMWYAFWTIMVTFFCFEKVKGFVSGFLWGDQSAENL